MSGYLLHFVVYTMAMLGMIFFAMYVYKFFAGAKIGGNASMLSVTDSMKLSPKKTLYVVKAGGEEFLIASDFDSTTLISRLDAKKNTETKDLKTGREDKSIKLESFDGVKSLNKFASVIEFEKKKTEKKPVMRELARKLSQV